MYLHLNMSLDKLKDIILISSFDWATNATRQFLPLDSPVSLIQKNQISFGIS